MRMVMAAAFMLAAAAGAGVAVAQVQAPQDRINTALARARQAGIPVSLLESKIAEGKAKGVSLERIATAVERREAALERASQVMMKGPDRTGDGELAVAADALESGVSEAALKGISETAPRDRRAVAIAALTQLVQLGHVPESALTRVQDALKRGPEALLNLPAEAGRQGGGPPNAPPGDAGRGRGRTGGPPASVPSPGGTTQPSRPDKPPAAKGRPTSGPGAGRGIVG